MRESVHKCCAGPAGPGPGTAVRGSLVRPVQVTHAQSSTVNERASRDGHRVTENGRDGFERSRSVARATGMSCRQTFCAEQIERSFRSCPTTTHQNSE